MSHKIDREMIEQIIQRVKQIHIMTLEISDHELNAALAFFRPSRYLRHVPTHEDVMTYYILRAIQQLRNTPPLEPGESPFEYHSK